jgi:putative ABC transport system permease protein
MTARGVYRYLLRLYPEWFRKRYAAQMEADFADYYARMGTTWGGRLRAWLVVAGDLTQSVLRERFTRRRATAPSRRSPMIASNGAVGHGFSSDARHAIRMFRRHPAFALTVVITLAIGIGTNVAMFVVLDRVLLSPLPYANADRLVVIWNRHVRTGAKRVQISGMDLRDYEDRTTTLAEFAYVHNSADNTIQTSQGAEQVDVGGVSPNFFHFLGREPFLGRGFDLAPDDLESKGASSSREVVISYGLWTRVFGGDRQVIGQTARLGSQLVQVIGVMPSDFELLMPDEDGGMTGGGAKDKVDVWMVLPQRIFDGLPRSLAMFRLFGRLGTGVTIEQAQGEMEVIAAQLREEHQVHEERGTQIDLVPMHTDVVGKAGPIVASLFGAVSIVLLIACANVANLVLVRSSQRRREVSVRFALGASRWRLIRQLLTENAILGVAGTILGLVLARIAVALIIVLAPSDVPLLDRLRFDSSVMWFVVGLTVLTIVLTGAAPAFRWFRRDFHAELAGGARGTSRRGHHVRTGLVIIELALSLTLLITGGLLTRTFIELQRTQLGFDPIDVMTAKVALHGARGGDALQIRRVYWDRLRRATANLPNVEHAALVWPLPFAGAGSQLPYARVPEGGKDWGRDVAAVVTVSPGYFEAMDIRIVDGRAYVEADLDGNRNIAVIDEVVAERLYPGERAVGRMIWVKEATGDARLPLEIVGVVGHMRHESVRGFERESIYRVSNDAVTMALVARTNGDQAGAFTALRQMAATIDPDTPLFDLRSFEEYVGDEIAPTRFTMTLASTFAVVALILAVVGLYGVVSYSVTQRAAELGVRLALGAHGGAILRLVLRHALAVAGAGISIGLGLSFMVTRTLRSMLVGVTPTDPMVFVGVSGMLALVALAASYVPARRAARLDPVRVLQSQ